ncbi:hypothetical protein PVAND_011241 [Polypedilum vanderplanki]|uniref:Ribosome-binding factor A n=1 Tax=Polypedilum vanderplanki TaxID=319348 RepID=A0A9J6CHY9_POLVA|nr:hypothetical protein PVAND_011241 [Polypedilum vanderplanki]
MAGREKGKRRWIYDENQLPKMVNPTKLSSTTKQGKEANRRVTVLNKLFMKNVTDLMATDLFAEELYGYGLQISNVKVDNDFKKMNIFWIASDMREDGKIEKILKSIAGPLRHELSVLRLMGEVPQINFVKDRMHMKTAEIDAVLKHADFGDDFVPTDPTLFLKSEPMLEMKMPEEMKQKLKEFESSVDLEEEEIEEDMPPMRHDSLGIDHAKIMNKIFASLNKSKQAWESYNHDESFDISISQLAQIKSTPDSISNEIDKLKNEAEMRENFIKFLEKRQWQRRNTPERKKSKRFLEEYEDDESKFDFNSDPIPDGDYLEEDDVKSKF